MERRNFLGIFGGAVTLPFFTWKRGEEALDQGDQALIPYVQQIPPQLWIDGMPVRDLLKASLHEDRYRRNFLGGTSDAALVLTTLFEDTPRNDLPAWMEEEDIVWHNIRLHLGTDKWQMRGIVTTSVVTHQTAPLTKVEVAFAVCSIERAS